MLIDSEKTIGNLIDKQSVTYISAVDEDGFPSTKAMLPPRKREGISVFYFTTNTSSMRAGQYKKNPKACIYFCDKRFFRGVTDPDYCVLKFTITSGRYYSNFKSETFPVPPHL